MQSTTDDLNEQHVVNYVPDEICVVVGSGRIEDAAGFYEQIRSILNRQIATLLKESPAGDDDRRSGPLGPDFRPVVLARRFAGDADVLQPLRRTQGKPDEPTYAPSAPQLTPFIPLRGGRAHHLYFTLGRDANPEGLQDVERVRVGLQSVRELVLLLNRFALTDQSGGEDVRIRAFSPNWLTIAHQFGCGCPAGLPIPVAEPPRYDFRFGDALGRALEDSARGEVVVAVLDTSPTQAMLDDAAARFRDNRLLTQVQKEIRMDSPTVSPPGFAAHLTGCLPRLQWDMQSGPAHDDPEGFAMPDHGLFVAGIVHQVLAGRGRVHLIRVLNDFGVGDLFTISHALAVVPELLVRPDSARLVVNLSLGIDLPIPARLLDRWLPALAQNVKTLREHAPEISQLLDLLHANLQDVIHSLTERGVLVVASSGNDALRQDVDPGDPPPPRFPARYRDVLGVAATRRDLTTASDYSNRGELSAAMWPGHVSTFGGQVVPAAALDQPATTDPADSLVGIFSSPSLPGGAANTSGWVRWAGTSFSTPLVAGTAARLWSIRPELGPLEVIARLRSFAHHPHGGGDPDAPLEVPVLDVVQV
jgi:Subtilase family